MNAERYAEVRALFLAACEREAGDRARYLDEACAGDAALRAEVERLLPHLARAESFLAAPALGVRLPVTDVEGLASGDGPRVPLSIGPYVLGRLLGEGGFGSVYEAFQTAPVRRRVALKVLKPGMDSRQVLARFEAERLALSRMEHPGIAQVLDAGETGDGRPFFAMECVEGLHLDEYCARHALGTRPRLELFRQVCAAIQHAHHKGVIHRDIKPSNVLVAEVDGRASLKVIDFGIAKAIGPEGDPRTLLTLTGQFVGTPAYMSPEQLDSRDVDTRSDVYSLGVLLYELLAGAPPFDAERLQRAGLAEILRILREEEPPKPSTRASGVVGTPSRAASRTARELRGDLDWIAMKALEKDRERRYATPAELALDVERHLRDEPVLAGPPTAGYRMRKFARRHAGASAAGGLVLAALLAGLAGTLWQARVAGAERDHARAAEVEATARRREAETRADTVRAVLQFLQEVFGSVRPAVAQGRVPTVREVLDSASARVGDGLAGEPAVEAEIRGILGSVYRSLGLPAEAKPHIERARELAVRAHGPDSPEALFALNNLAASIAEEGRPAEAESLYREALDAARRVLGPEHLRTLTALNNLAQTLRRQGRPAEAEPLLREALELRLKTAAEDDAFALAARANLAGVLAATGRLAEAEPLLRSVLAFRKSASGDSHPETLESADALAVVLAGLGRSDEARALFSAEVATLREIAGPEHPQTLAAEANLAGLRLADGTFEEAAATLRRVHEVLARRFGAHDPRTLEVAVKLGWSLCALERPAEAAALLQSAEAELRVRLGAGHPSTLRALTGLATAVRDGGDLVEAESLFREALLLHDESGDPGAALVARHGLAETLRRAGDLAAAEPLFADLVREARARLAADHWQTAQFEADWARCLSDLGRYEEAAPLIARSRAVLERALGADEVPARRARELEAELAARRR